MSIHYEVIVGNVGNVGDYTEFSKAKQVFDEYVEISKTTTGLRPSGEQVTLFNITDCYPVREYFPGD